MNRKYWIPVAAVAMFTLVGCDQAQTPGGQAMESSGERQTAPDATQPSFDEPAGQVRSEGGVDDNAQSVIEPVDGDLSRGIVARDQQGAGSSTWTMKPLGEGAESADQPRTSGSEPRAN